MTVDETGFEQIGPKSKAGRQPRRLEQPRLASIRAFFRPVRTHQPDLGASAVVAGQIWMGRSPVRPAALWAAVAGVLAAGDVLFSLPLSWHQIVLLLLLVDLFWGALWRLAAGRAEVLPLPRRDAARVVRLPYLTADSPAAHLLGDNTAEMWPVLFRIALPAALVAFVTASALGVEAVLLTLALLAVTTFGWISTRRAHQMPLLLQSVASIGLPWILGALLSGVTPESQRWLPLLAVVTFFVLHEWGIGRLQYSRTDRLGQTVVVASDLALGLFLIWLQVPLWLGLWFVSSLSLWLALLQQRSLEPTAPWRLVAMLIAAVGVGQSILP